jgi:hypothetical protein
MKKLITSLFSALVFSQAYGVEIPAQITSPLPVAVLTKEPSLSGEKMKTIGIIGGITWVSSIEYYRLINQLVQKNLVA